MSSNLGTDQCKCGYKFGIPDFVGKPIEFRQCGDYRPEMGTKLICPKCGIVYFGWIRTGYEFWGRECRDYFDKPQLPSHNGIPSRKNCDQGKFAKRYNIPIWNERQKTSDVIELGFYQIDLSFYETGRDEGKGIDDELPAGLITEDHELTRWTY